MSRYKVIPARTTSGAFFVFGDEAHAVRVATEARNACKMSMLVVHHPEGGLVEVVTMVAYVDPDEKIKKIKARRLTKPRGTDTVLRMNTSRDSIGRFYRRACIETFVIILVLAIIIALTTH